MHNRVGILGALAAMLAVAPSGPASSSGKRRKSRPASRSGGLRRFKLRHGGLRRRPGKSKRRRPGHKR
jgi:hypothetical protein